MRICLVSEGTYPYAMGGVSVWCDQLIRGLPKHRWQMVPLVVDGSEAPQWALPDGLELTPLPLWSASADKGRPTAEQLTAYRRVFRLIATPLHDLADAGREGRVMLEALQEFRAACLPDVRPGEHPDWLTHDSVLDASSRIWNDINDVPVSLRDLIDFARLFGHLLRPLFTTTVEADVVHASMNGPSVLVGLAAKWDHGTPIVLSEHGIYLRERYLLDEAGPMSDAVRFLRLNFFRLLASAGYVAADAVTPHSKYNTRWQLRGGVDEARIHVMYNGVLVDDFQVATSEPKVPTISFLGRIDPIKDIKNLVSAFALVHERLPEARLRIFGAAPAGQEAYLQECRALAASSGVADAVVFEGPTREPVDAYHAGTIVALTSISEGFPYTVVEAMACGRPVVCTQVGGVPEAVADAGLVVPPKDPRAFADACLTLLLDSEDRGRKARIARRRVEEWFTIDRWVDAYDQVYSLVTQKDSQRGPHDDPESESSVVLVGAR